MVTYRVLQMKKTTIIGVSVPQQVQALLSVMDSIEFFAVDSIPPKRPVPHYRELEVSKKKGKRRNY